MAAPLPGMVAWKSSQQVRLPPSVLCSDRTFDHSHHFPHSLTPPALQVVISLRKFAKTMKTAKAKGRLVAGGPTRGMELSPKGLKDAMAMSDVSTLVGADMKGIDTSIWGIVRRVALLVLVLVAIGLLLYFVGLELMFPKTV